MKKTFLLAIGILLTGLVVYATTATFTIDVNSIPNKSSSDYVTNLEFNKIIGVLKGIFNVRISNTEYHLGLNGEPSKDVDLTVHGAMRIEPVNSNITCNAATAGTMFFNSTNHHLWGCNGTNIVKLDGLTEYNEFTCTDGAWVQGGICLEVNYDSGRSYNPSDKVCSDVTPDNNTCQETACGEITDVNLQQVILDKLGKNNWSEVTRTDLEGISILKANSKNIQNIDGICKLKNVQYLYLDNNQITTIPTEIGNLTKLLILDLFKNKITTIPTEIGNLINLTSLDLDTNKITTIPTEIGNLTNLKILDLSVNEITTIPVEIGNLIGLEKILLNANQITTIPTEIGNLENLGMIALDGNKITTIPTEIGNLTNLEALGLSSNQITTIPAEIGNLMGLHVVKLSDNQIISISTELNKLNLVALSLENNIDLSCFPDKLSVDGISGLDIGNTKICCADIDTTNINHCNSTGSTCTQPVKSCEESVSTGCDGEITDKELQQVIVDTLKAENWESVTTEDLEKITTLEAGSRNIRNIDGICKLKNIETLVLENNSLSGEFPSDIWKLAKLKNLSLAANRFEGEIPDSIAKIEGLSVLDLSRNNFSSVPGSLIEFKKLTNLYLNENPSISDFPKGVSVEELIIGGTELKCEEIDTSNIKVCKD